MIPDALTVLQNWARDTTDVQFIWRNSNAPRPTRPYGTIQMLSAVAEEHATVGAVDANGVAQVTHHYAVVTRLELYDKVKDADGRVQPPAALSKLWALRQNLGHPSTALRLAQDGGWAFVRVLLGPQDVAALVGTEQEPRATMDIEWRIAEQTADDLGLVERVAITGTADGETIMDQEVAL